MGTLLLIVVGFFALLILIPMISGIGRGLSVKAEKFSIDLLISSSKKLTNTLAKIACEKFLSNGHSRSSVVSIQEAKKIIQECTSKCDHKFDEIRNIACYKIDKIAKKAGGYTFAMIMAEVCLYSQSEAIINSMEDAFISNCTGPTVLEVVFREAFEVGQQNGLFDENGPEQQQLTDIPFEVMKEYAANSIFEKIDRSIRSSPHV